VEEIRHYRLRNLKQTPAWNISAHVTHSPDSPTISSTLASTNKDKWVEAIDKEVSALEAAGTWTMVPHQPGMNILRSHLVLKAKRDTADAIIKYKARLVAGGDAQLHGLDFDQSYAYVADSIFVRVILSIAATVSCTDWTSRTRSCVPHWQKSCMCVHPRFWLIDSGPRS
jgi:hypothetical protein